MNFYKQLLGVLPNRPLQIGDVVDFVDGTATIEMLDGGRVQARGDVSIGDRVFFRDGAIEGPAPSLALVVIDI